MAEKDEINNDVENSESWENLFRDEWTILDENCSEKNDIIDDGIKEDEEPAGSMEVIETPENDTILDNETNSIIIEKHDEDSDGISVITESEAEQLVINKRFSEIDGGRNNVLGALKIYEKTGEKTAPQVGTILNVVIACSLAAIIGLGAGRILGMEDKCPVNNAIDFSMIKIESDNLINQIKELSEVKDVLDEIRASIPQVKDARDKIFQHESKSKRSKRSQRREKPSKISDTYIFDPDTTILEQLQTSLNTLYSVIDGINPENDFVKSDTVRTQGVVADLIEFKKIIHTVIKELEATGRPREMEFLRHAEKRIRDVCESLLNDLSYTVHGMAMKIHHKLNKVRRKLNKRLCLLEDSESFEETIFDSLDENNSFLESCDKILNVTSKPDPQTAKNDRNEESGKKINPKKRSPMKSVPVSEDPMDASSDSSTPDSTYDPDDNDFRKKEQIPRRARRESRRKSSKIGSDNDFKRRKFRSAKSMKSSGGRCLRKSMMEVLVPANTCPLTREHSWESEFIYLETRRVETRILNQKPLYSTVLKSVVNVTSSVKSNFQEDKLSMNETPEDTRAEFTEEELRVKIKKAKERLTEAKHKITPSKSGMNPQTIKSIKEKWNNKIRQPIEKPSRVSRGKRILESEENFVEKEENPQQSEEVLKQSSEHYRKGKNRSFNDSAALTESDKRPASNERHAKYKKNEKSAKQKTVNKKPVKVRDNEEKETKKGKYEEKVSSPLGTEKGFKKRSNNEKTQDQMVGDWQLQRSRAREMHRDRDHRSEWFFDRADSRQDARKNDDEVRNAKSGAGKFSYYQPCESYRKDKCKPIFEERIYDEEFDDHWREAKDKSDRKYSNSRATFMGKKKMIKMPHRKNIIQSKRR